MKRKTKLLEKIYDTLFQNTNNKQFEPEKATFQEIDYVANTITIQIGGVYYILSIKEANNA